MAKSQRLIRLCVICICLWIGADFALFPVKPLELYKHRVYTTEHGLPQNSIFAITQTPDGFIWVGTNGGLARFDGAEMETFNKRTTPGMTGDICEYFLVRRDGTLLVGTSDGGVLVFRNGRFSGSYTEQDGLLNNKVHALLQLRDDSVLVGTAAGLNRVEKGNVYVVPLAIAGGPDYIRAITEDSRGRLWLATTSGLLVLQPDRQGESVRYKVQYRLLDEISVSSLALTFAGGEELLWVGAEGKGLFQIDGGGKVRVSYTYADGLSSNMVGTLYRDPDGSLWIGTRGGGVNRLQDGKISVFSVEKGLSHSYVSSFFKDRNGNLWVGTNGGGVNLLVDSPVSMFTAKNGLSHGQVYGIHQDREGVVWVGTYGFGVNCIKDDRVIRYYTVDDGLPSNFVITLCQDREYAMWFGTFGGGAARLKDGRFTKYTTGDGLISNFVYGLYIDIRGRLWAGTNQGGLHRFEKGKFTLVAKLKGKVRAFLDDGAGSLWIATDAMGVVRLTGDKIETFDKTSGLAVNDAMTIYQDSDYTIWVGTYGGGLNRFDKKTGRFRAVRQADGLPDDVIYWILKDYSGNLWISTMEGIFKVGIAELEAFFAGNAGKISGILYDEADGMKVRECNGGVQASGIGTLDGKLWFNTAAGVAVVDPAPGRIRSYPTPLVIKNITINEKIYYPGDPGLAAVPPGKGDIRIRFSGINFDVPEHIKFRYKLEGYDEEWRDAERRAANYTNISHGNYRFLLRATNRQGKWGDNEAVVSIAILPYYWQSWWFQLLAIFSFLLLAGMFYMLKTRGIKKRQQELEREVAERTRKLKNKTLELETKTGELEKINTIVKSINAAVQHEDILISIIKEAGLLDRIQRAVALVYEKDLDCYVFKGVWGYEDGQLDAVRLTPPEVKGRYITGTDEVFTDVFLVQNPEDRPGDDKARTFGLPKCMLAIRIKGGEESEPGIPAAGYLVFEDMENVHGFEKQDVELLVKLKDHIDYAFLKSKLLVELEKEREAAEAASYAKSMFLARMSHEIRTPMNSVIGFADMLRDTNLTGEQKEFVHNITTSGESLLYLIDEILDFSKIEAGRLSFEPVVFRPREMVGDVCRLVMPRLEDKPVRVSFRIDDNTPMHVKSDADRIRQVLVNLMGNAAKFTESGEIMLSLAVAEEVPGRVKLHYSVQDSGIGIPEGQLGEVFDVFQQADGSTTRKYGGTGLGLAISRQIARLMGGDIRVESTEGEGSIFSFTAWVEKAEAGSLQPPPEPETEPQSQLPAQTFCVLLAEDNPLNQKLARFILTKGGVELDIANNGVEAVQQFTANPGKYHLVFMDINMPEMDGLEATRKIREKGFLDIPIIAMTAHALKEDRDQCMQAGMNDFVTKPIKRDIVFGVMTRWLGKEIREK